MIGGFRSRSLHGGYEPERHGSSFTPPIHQTTAIRVAAADHAAKRYAMEADGDVYSRISNPTTRTLVSHPASTAHAQLSEAKFEAAGVRPALSRFSVRLEEPEDTTADVAAAVEGGTV
jgi:O-acetylhomoserine/O-acetylserine sulfhydrylase-like pyridoxal-dependent enzyme